MRQVFYSSPWIHEPEPEELFRIYAAYGERIKVKAGVDLPYSGEDALVCYLEKGLRLFRTLISRDIKITLRSSFRNKPLETWFL